MLGCSGADENQTKESRPEDSSQVCKDSEYLIHSVDVSPEELEAGTYIIDLEIKDEHLVYWREDTLICIQFTNLSSNESLSTPEDWITLDGAVIYEASAYFEKGATLVVEKSIPIGTHTMSIAPNEMHTDGFNISIFTTISDSPPEVQENLEQFLVTSTTSIVSPNEKTTISIPGFELIIPPEAVLAPTQVTIQEIEQPYGMSNNFILKPHGLKFRKEIEVNIEYDPTQLPPEVTEDELVSAGDLVIQHDLEFIETTINSQANLAQAYISHFSQISVAVLRPLIYTLYE